MLIHFNKAKFWLQRLPIHLYVLTSYTGLTLALTWPLASVWNRVLPDGTDGWRYLWNLWWIKTALVDQATTPLHTDYLYYPYGTNLYIDTPTLLLGVVGIPLQWLGVPLVGVYNLLVLLSFVLAGYGTYLLVVYLTRIRSAAFVAGIVFAFCPYHFAHLLGHLNLLSLQGIPFYVLALFKMWGLGGAPFSTEEREPIDKTAESTNPAESNTRLPILGPHLGWAITAGMLLAVNAYIEWTYALFLALFTLWFVIWRLMVRRRELAWLIPGAQPASPHPQPVMRYRQLFRSLIVLGGVALVLLLPILVPAVQEAFTTSYARTNLQDAAGLSADLTDAFMPTVFHPLWHFYDASMGSHYWYRPRAERVIFVGYSVLLVSMFVLWRFRRHSDVTFWGWTAFGFWILSLGPILHIWGERIFLGVRVPLPYAVLYFMPFFNILRVPSRLMVLVMLALAVLVGYALALLVRAWTKQTGNHIVRRHTWAASLLMAVLVGFEFLSVPYPLMKYDYQLQFYQDIAQEPGHFGILDLPLQPLPLYEAYQTLHKKPIIGGYLARQPPDRFVDESPILRYLLPATPVNDPLVTEAIRTGVADLRRFGVHYVIVHWWLPYGEEQTALQIKVKQLFTGVPVQQLPSEQMSIYQLDP